MTSSNPVMFDHGCVQEADLSRREAGNRLQFGFYSVLARLDVEVDYAQTELAFLPTPRVEKPG